MVSWKSCLLSTDEFKEFPLPDRLFWLYFPLRPLLWFYHHYIKKMLPSPSAKSQPKQRASSAEQ